MFYGDESYGRNDGYYVLLETLRDIIERKEPKYAFKNMFIPKPKFSDIHD